MIEKRTWFARIFLLGLWAFILLFLGRSFDAFLIIVLSLIFFIFRRRAYLLLAASVLVIVAFNTPLLDTWSKLRDLNLSTYHHVSPALAQLFRPNSGQEVLPIQVRQMLSLIQAHQVTNYRLSKTLDEDAWIGQRMTEAAWPIKKEETSPYLFSTPEEFSGYPDCEILDQQEDVVLGNCH